MQMNKQVNCQELLVQEEKKKKKSQVSYLSWRHMLWPDKQFIFPGMFH